MSKQIIFTLDDKEYNLVLEAIDALSSNTHEELKGETDRDAIENNFENRCKADKCEKLTKKLKEIRKFG